MLRNRDFPLTYGSKSDTIQLWVLHNKSCWTHGNVKSWLATPTRFDLRRVGRVVGSVFDPPARFS